MRSIFTFILFAIIMGTSFSLRSQTISDALRYSRYEVLGTARNTGMAGTLCITGGDLSAVSFNPAGTATFRKSRMSVSFGHFNKTTTTLFAGNSNDVRGNSNGLRNISFVSVNRPGGASDWKTINISISYNQLADFTQPFRYEGETPGSISDRWLEQALGFSPEQFNPFEEGLAANAGVLILTDSINWNYTTDYQDYNHGKELAKKEYVHTSGSMNRLNLNFAGNYKNKLQIGMGLNVNFINYSAYKYYHEYQGKRDKIDYFDRLYLADSSSTTGSGISFSLGGIYRPVHPVFLSFSYESPTYWTLDDNYSRSLSYTYKDAQGNIQSIDARSPLGSFEYGLKTPMRLNFGAGYIFGKRGMFLAGMDWVNYGGSRFNLIKKSSDPGDLEYQKALNTDLQYAYSSALKFNVGAELVAKYLRFRGGLLLEQRPYSNDRKFDLGWSLGMGFNSDKFFFDISFLRHHQTSGYVPYLTKNRNVFPIQVVSLSTRNTNLDFTMGFRF